MTPGGLRYVPDFLGGGEQAELLRRLDGIPAGRWQDVWFRGRAARRRKLAFGWNYEPGERRLSPAPPLPEFLEPLRDRCAAAAGLVPGKLVQATLTLYPPGAGIGPHKDAPFFGGEVVGVSLGAPRRIVFRSGTERYPLDLEPGSLLVVRGPARELWTHELRAVPATRYSIYFRSLRRPRE